MMRGRQRRSSQLGRPGAAGGDADPASPIGVAAALRGGCFAAGRAGPVGRVGVGVEFVQRIEFIPYSEVALTSHNGMRKDDIKTALGSSAPQAHQGQHNHDRWQRRGVRTRTRRPPGPSWARLLLQYASPTADAACDGPLAPVESEDRRRRDYTNPLMCPIGAHESIEGVWEPALPIAIRAQDGDECPTSSISI